MTELVIGGDTPARVAEHLAGRAALVVSDANTHEVLGGAVGSAASADELVFEPRSGLLAGLEEARRVAARLEAGPAGGVPVAVGSGVITDIVRYAAHALGREFVSVATAASMDGYASSVAAMQVHGVKVTYPARAPEAIFADPVVVAAAPAELTRAGLGDLLGKATAGVDWRCAHELYGEALSEPVLERVAGLVRGAAAGVDGVMAGEPSAVEGLLRGLIESGRAMAEVGSSRPASGCEHHASHFWDLLAARGLRAYGSHGLQVGYATRFALRLQRFAFASGAPPLRRPVPPADPLGPAARRWLGEPTAELRTAVAEKQALAGTPFVSDDWQGIRERLTRAMDGFEAVDAALARAGIPLDSGFLGVDAGMLRATFRFATRLRARYTTLDFLEGQGRLEEAIAGWLPAALAGHNGRP